MRLPRDITGRELADLLRRHFDYETVRQTDSHLRLATSMGGEHRVTVPVGGPVGAGTLAAVLSDVAEHQGMTRADLEGRLFD